MALPSYLVPPLTMTDRDWLASGLGSPTFQLKKLAILLQFQDA